MRRPTAALTAAVLAIGVGACGSHDASTSDPTSTSSTPTGGSSGPTDGSPTPGETSTSGDDPTPISDAQWERVERWAEALADRDFEAMEPITAPHTGAMGYIYHHWKYDQVSEGVESPWPVAPLTFASSDRAARSVQFTHAGGTWELTDIVVDEQGRVVSFTTPHGPVDELISVGPGLLPADEGVEVKLYSAEQTQDGITAIFTITNREDEVAMLPGAPVYTHRDGTEQEVTDGILSDTFEPGEETLQLAFIPRGQLGTSCRLEFQFPDGSSSPEFVGWPTEAANIAGSL